MKHLLRKGIFRPVESGQLFAVLDYYCDPRPRRGVAVAAGSGRDEEAQCVFGVYTPAESIARGIEIPNVMRVPLIRQMHRIDSSTTTTTTTTNPSSSSATNTTDDAKSLFLSAPTFSSAVAVVAEAFRVKLSKVLGIPPAEIQLQHRVESYGVDSLVAVELRNWLAKEWGAEVAVFEILGGATLEGVGGRCGGEEWVGS